MRNSAILEAQGPYLAELDATSGPIEMGIQSVDFFPSIPTASPDIYTLAYDPDNPDPSFDRDNPTVISKVFNYDHDGAKHKICDHVNDYDNACVDDLSQDETTNIPVHRISRATISRPRLPTIYEDDLPRLTNGITKNVPTGTSKPVLVSGITSKATQITSVATNGITNEITKNIPTGTTKPVLVSEITNDAPRLTSVITNGITKHISTGTTKPVLVTEIANDSPRITSAVHKITSSITNDTSNITSGITTTTPTTTIADAPFRHHDCPSDTYDGTLDNPDAIRGIIDTGAKVTCTNLLYILHDYVSYSRITPSPIRLTAAIAASSVVPLGFGYIHLPSPNRQGFIAVKSFYHPELTSTLINEDDILKSSGHASSYTGLTLHKWTDTGHFTLACHHRTTFAKNIHVHGVLVAGTCYSHPCIIPDLPLAHPEATIYNSQAFALKHDPAFLALCKQRTVDGVRHYKSSIRNLLRDSLIHPTLYSASESPVVTALAPTISPFQHRRLCKSGNDHVPYKLADTHATTLLASISDIPILAIKNRTCRMLWHQRLGHPCDAYLYNAHKTIDGVPKFVSQPRVLSTCPTCIQAKQTKSAPGHHPTRVATQPYQGLSIDYGFSGMVSANSERRKDYEGLNNETAWILVTDHFTGMKHGDTRQSKSSPIEWLRHFLNQYSPHCAQKYVHMDQGGELFRNPDICNLFSKFQYAVHPTGADSSHQNGSVERAHRTVGCTIRALLIGANLDIKFWPYAFYHMLRISNAIPERHLQDSTNTASPLYLATGRKEDFSRLRTFGCRIWVRPPGRRSAKFLANSRKGIFLGFARHTTRNMLWYDVLTTRVKLASHARFDEGMNDLPLADIPPNVQHLQRAEDDAPLPMDATETLTKDLQFFITPFANLHIKTMDTRSAGTDPTYGLIIRDDELMHRAFVFDIKAKSCASKLYTSLQGTRRHIKGAYITTISGNRVFNKKDVLSTLAKLHDQGVSSVVITFAPEAKQSAQQARRASNEYSGFAPATNWDSHTEMDTDPVNAVAIEPVNAVERTVIPVNASTRPVNAVKRTVNAVNDIVRPIKPSAPSSIQKPVNASTRPVNAVKRTVNPVNARTRPVNAVQRTVNAVNDIVRPIKPSAPSKPESRSDSDSSSGSIQKPVNASTRPVNAVERTVNGTSVKEPRPDNLNTFIEQHFAPTEADLDAAPTMTIEDLRAISRLRTLNTEATIRHPSAPSITRLGTRNPDLHKYFNEDELPHDLVTATINAIQSKSTTPAEQALGHFTRRKLKGLDTWNDWEAGERKQLTQFHDLQMFGAPVMMPKDRKTIILRPHWQYHIKRDGTRRARLCCNGSKQAAPLLHALSLTYSSCVEHPVQRLFLAIAADLDLKLYGGDAKDAYAHSPGPELPTYMSIDDQYADWYKFKFGKTIDRKQVLPVLRALQGHPESGRLWEHHINGILTKMGFKSTTHDRTIYTTLYTHDNGKKEIIYMLRQVDDFALACKDESTAKAIYNAIGKKLKLPNESDIPFSYLGLIEDFNGIDIEQSKTHVRISCQNYIDRLLISHGWTTEKSMLPQEIPVSPMKEDITDLYTDTGFKEGSSEHQALEESQGFAYRTLLGEMMYAYVTCRPDIGFAISTLSKFGSSPAACHYLQLKNVCRYLRTTRMWGISYKRSTVRTDLPDTSTTFIDVEPDLPDFPREPTGNEDKLQCFVDAAYANDPRKRKSTTGFAFTYCGSAIVYRSKTQSIIALSSTEAELIAAVEAAKVARFLRSMLKELGFHQKKPTVIYEDNQSTIHVVNSRAPTARTRHIDIRYFAIQDWKEQGDIVLKHIPGKINPADDFTKPLGRLLHGRHARRIMGHYK